MTESESDADADSDGGRSASICGICAICGPSPSSICAICGQAIEDEDEDDTLCGPNQPRRYTMYAWYSIRKKYTKNTKRIANLPTKKF